MLFNCGVEEDSLRVSWTTGRSSQSILKEISPDSKLTERTDAEAQTPVFWPFDSKN